ncbi:UDP-N-acetylmuramoylalanine--D-glutamate ligase [Striga asiatica]|uniref:UDP-N-acetylmuramoylalanine--D-glutamate ligase n=1 Tax=Striga asiatica TaxID=4170 RepID=A0A5A7Q2G3_STRAF|nr:UDP-N-acetylmuramoylalanine--D-glutamate ligase [Striga asiatica]
MDSFSAQAGESSASGKSKRDGKRKRNVEVEDKIIGLISSGCEETNKRLSELSTHFTNQADAKSNELHNTVMDQTTSLGNIARRFRLEGWTEEEEEVCYRLFFHKCAEMDDVHMAPVLDSLWFGLSRQLSELMQKDFSWMKVRDKIHYLGDITMTTPGFGVHDDDSLVSVNRDYWNFVGEETNLEVYFHWNGFKWYNECVQLWNLQGAAQVDIESNPSQTLPNPIVMYNCYGSRNNCNGVRLPRLGMLTWVCVFTEPSDES